MKENPTQEALAGKCVRGILCGFDQAGEALVDFPDNSDRVPIVAISTVALTEKDLNREVVLLFEDGDYNRPILIGIRQPSAAQKEAVQQTWSLDCDGRRLMITAQQEIVLQCGKASLHLHKDGGIRIRGTDVVSRASATNRIRGGNVQIN
jgi:hypothetical protein